MFDHVILGLPLPKVGDHTVEFAPVQMQMMYNIKNYDVDGDQRLFTDEELAAKRWHVDCWAPCGRKSGRCDSFCSIKKHKVRGAPTSKSAALEDEDEQSPFYIPADLLVVGFCCKAGYKGPRGGLLGRISKKLVKNFDDADGLPYDPGVAGCSSGERDWRTLKPLPDLGGNNGHVCVYHDSRMSNRGWEGPIEKQGMATHDGLEGDPTEGPDLGGKWAIEKALRMIHTELL